MGRFSAFIVYRGMRIASRAPDRMGQVMAFGFSAAIAIYAIVNASVASGLIPTTGVPMPFLSYGGMSLIFTMSSMGIVLNIASRSNGRMTVVKGRENRAAFKKRIHLVGIGGAGMSGLAELLHHYGHHVTGSDRAASPPPCV